MFLWPRDHLGHVAGTHPHVSCQALQTHAQLAGPLPDVGALPLDQAALAVHDALPGDLSQHRHGSFPQHGSPGPAPAGHRGQVAVVHAHPVRQLLQGEAVPPGRRPKLALTLALGLSLFRRAGLYLRSPSRSRYGVSFGVDSCLGVNAGSHHVASSKTQKAGPAQRDRPRSSVSTRFSVVGGGSHGRPGFRRATQGRRACGSC